MLPPPLALLFTANPYPPPLLPQTFLASAASPAPGLATGAAVNSTVYLLGIGVLLRGLTWEGVVSSWFLGTLTYAAFGPGAYAIVCLYFIVGSLVTKLKLEQKQREGIAEARSGRRGLVRGCISSCASNIAVSLLIIIPVCGVM